MRTIAISIDEATLKGVDRAAKTLDANRSKVVRVALAEYLAKLERQRQEASDREAFARNRARLRAQARALVTEQAKP